MFSFRTRNDNPWATFSDPPSKLTTGSRWTYDQPIEHVPSGDAFTAFAIWGRWTPRAILAITDALAYMLPARVAVLHPGPAQAQFVVYLGPKVSRVHDYGIMDAYSSTFARAQAALVRGRLNQRGVIVRGHRPETIVAPPGTPSEVLWRIRTGPSGANWDNLCKTIEDRPDAVSASEGWTKCRHGWAGYLPWIESGVQGRLEDDTDKLVSLLDVLEGSPNRTP